ncbi:anion transporter [Bacillus bingmayongensis]|uniref:anion transporter n=1 Tax=Bacillus bingmayongensis TaxID=1150157 RepID=UPI001C8D57CE|nr:anion transporter [Bacillus bingmayongensis]MBY0598794.1 anion transporter [Bacillus bingmayongensis]
MKELIFVQNKKRILMKFVFLKKDIVLTLSLVLAVVSCFIYPPRLEYINFEVLISLFNLMVAIKAFEELKLLDKLAVAILNKCNNSRSISVILILLCFICSMFVTNDVALLTFVPITLVISKKTQMNMMDTIILQTIAANIGSSLMPMGNPQNLYIYSYYGIKIIPFWGSILLLAVLGISLLFIFTQKLHKTELKIELPVITIEDQKKATVWILILVIIIASIFGVINYYIALIITLVTVFILNRKLLFKIDYSLLITFVCFFVFIGNISNSNAMEIFARANLRGDTSIFFSSIFLSQLISNLPASILLSNFTSDWKPLLLGVNIGGLGTIIASLASVISYKLFIQANRKESKKYLIKFSIYNFSFLVILACIQYFIFKFLKIF